MAGFFRRLFDRTTGRSGANPAAPGLASYSPEEFFAGDEAWERVDSSNLYSYAYLATEARDRGLLRVRFWDEKTGRITSEYEYSGIPQAIWEGLYSASSRGDSPATSKGKNLNAFVKKGGYAYRQIW